MDLTRGDVDEMDFTHDDARKTVVSTFLKMRSLEKFVYVYDFGDDWIHDITLEKIDEGAVLEHPVCLTGKGACPPEDCGGIYGYEEMKEVFAQRPKSKQAKEYRQWLLLNKNEEFDPVRFDFEEVNGFLEGLPYDDEVFDNFFNHNYFDDDDEELDKDIDFNIGETEGFFKKLMERPGNVSLVDVLKSSNKATIKEQAEAMHIELNNRLGEQNIKKQFAEKLLADPLALLRQLPMQELLILKKLQDEPSEENLVDCYDDFYKPIMVYFNIFGEWYDFKNVSYYVQIPDDLWQAVKPHLTTVLSDLEIQRRIGCETVIEGLCNLYGQVSRGFVKKELVRLGEATSLEEADCLLTKTQEQSILLKFVEYRICEESDSADESVLYLSRYSWDSPDELADFVRKNNMTNYRLFSDIEITLAARNPCPIIPNEQEEAFKTFLDKKLHLNEWEVTKTCHRLWYYYMQMGNSFAEHMVPGEYFANDVLHNCEHINKALFLEALRQLDLYLNNLPNWKLCGHTPAEMNKLLSKCAEDEDLRRLATESTTTPYHRHRVPANDYNPVDWLTPTMPIVIPKTPGRNDPCPCGSGKKYKHCCGRGN